PTSKLYTLSLHDALPICADPPVLDGAAHDPAEHLSGNRQRKPDPRGADGLRASDQAAGGGQHLPRRHAVEELRRHPSWAGGVLRDRKSTRLNSSHVKISY